MDTNNRVVKVWEGCIQGGEVNGRKENTKGTSVILPTIKIIF